MHKSHKLARTDIAPSDTAIDPSVWPSAMARLGEAIGHIVVASAANALSLVHQPAIAIDPFGVVLETNEEMHRIFDCGFKIRNQRLTTNDRQAATSLQRFIDQLPDMPNDGSFAAQPIIVRRNDKRAIVIRALPVHPLVPAPVRGAYALLTFSLVGSRSPLDQVLLSRVFLLTPAEARLAALVAAGLSLKVAAEELAIKRETARNQLKAIFAKTGTHRQGQLIALLLTLCSLA
jgi:DNA-binding CsgD family transcriptional regulator